MQVLRFLVCSSCCANIARVGRRRDTRSTQRSLPAFERRPTKLRPIAHGREAGSLLGLLAGRDKVQTFLALLNQQAVASGVQIQRYEPLKPPSLAQGQGRRNNSRSNSKQKAEQPQDPLQALGYRKSSVALEVSGSFGGLQNFLQRMEGLELLVESSDLSLQASASGKSDDETSPKQSATKLALQLSFYDLVPQPANPSTAAGSTKTLFKPG